MSLKTFLQDFPTANGRVVATICLIILTGLVVCVRLALGVAFPEGYDQWIWMLVVLAGVDSAHVVGKRLSDFRYKNAGTPAVEVGGPSTVNVGEGVTNGDGETRITVTKPAAHVPTKESPTANINPPGEGD